MPIGFSSRTIHGASIWHPHNRQHCKLLAAKRWQKNTVYKHMNQIHI